MDTIWWNKVTNASCFLETIVASVQNGQSVLLELPDTIPWYMTMKEIIENEISMQNSDSACKYVLDTKVEPGEYLLKTFCKKEKQAKYRPLIGYPRFLAKSNDIVLNDRILWIADVDKKQVQKWVDFIENYNKELEEGRKGCRFIIETREKCNISNRKGIQFISFEKKIEYYDNYVFNMLAASSLKGTQLFKQYLAEVVSIMFPNDIELSSKCISDGKRFLKNPIKVIQSIIEQESRSDGAYFNVSVKQEELQERLWEAQIKIIFPLIEKHRSVIVKKYKSQIEVLLPIEGSYGETFNEVNEVELGTISYLQGKGKIQMSSDDISKVEKLKKARNDLAHIKTLAQSQVDEIFSFEIVR